MTRAGPRVVAPTFETRCGRTWLTYPEFYPGPDILVAGDSGGTRDPAQSSGLVHGVAVFRDTSFDSDRRQWLERAKAVVSEGVGREGVMLDGGAPGEAPGGAQGGAAVECDDVRPDRILVPWQVHSARVCDAEALADGEECDGLVTGTPGVMVGVTVADCVPLLAVNEETGRAGAAHCGWRGTAAGIVEEFVDALDAPDAAGAADAPGAQGAHGVDGNATRYLIGPSIGRCCYEVGEDMLSHFSERDRETCVSRSPGGTGGTFFDLKAAVVARLMGRGISPEHICVDNTCTSCQQYKLSSYRAGGRDCGRMLAFVMLTRRGAR